MVETRARSSLCKEKIMGDRAYTAVFTAESVEPRTAANGRPYLRARGVIANRRESIRRTVVVQGKGYDAIAPRMRVGEALGLRGFYKRVENPGRRPGGQFFAAFGLSERKASTAGMPSAPNAIDAGAKGALTIVTDAVPDETAAPIAKSIEAMPTSVASTRTRRPSPIEAARETDEDAGYGPVEASLDLQEADLVLLEPLRQLAEHERPAPPTLEELEAAQAASQQAPTTMLLDGVETAIGPDWMPSAPRSVEGHDREGYWRRQRHGPKNSLVKIIWIAATRVKGGSRRQRVVPPMTLRLD
jgi:hypothetical protein